MVIRLLSTFQQKITWRSKSKWSRRAAWIAVVCLPVKWVSSISYRIRVRRLFCCYWDTKLSTFYSRFIRNIQITKRSFKHHTCNLPDSSHPLFPSSSPLHVRSISYSHKVLNAKVKRFKYVQMKWIGGRFKVSPWFWQMSRWNLLRKKSLKLATARQ